METLSSLVVTRWRRWHSGKRCCRVWCQLSVSVGWWWCTWTVMPSACLRILRCAILPRKAYVCIASTRHTWLSIYRSLHSSIPGKHNSPVLFFTELCVRICDQVFHFLYCVARKPSFAHFVHIEDPSLVRLFQLYPTSCLAIVSDMLKTYKKLVAAYNIETQVLPQPHTLL